MPRSRFGAEPPVQPDDDAVPAAHRCRNSALSHSGLVRKRIRQIHGTGGCARRAVHGIRTAGDGRDDGLPQRGPKKSHRDDHHRRQATGILLQSRKGSPEGLPGTFSGRIPSSKYHGPHQHGNSRGALLRPKSASEPAPGFHRTGPKNNRRPAGDYRPYRTDCFRKFRPVLRDISSFVL